MATSLPVQQTPAMLMPLAPTDLASAIISGSCEYMTIISDREGSWPWTMMLTMSFSMTPMLAVVSTGFGVPNRMSENSVPIMEPPQPSDRPARRDCLMRASGSEEQPICVMCSDCETSRSIARGSMPASCHSFWVCSGARLR